MNASMDEIRRLEKAHRAGCVVCQGALGLDTYCAEGKKLVKQFTALLQVIREPSAALPGRDVSPISHKLYTQRIETTLWLMETNPLSETLE